MNIDDFFIDGDVEATDAAAIRTVVRTLVEPVSSGAPLYWDLETIPDSDRLSSFDLPPLPEIPTEANEADLPDPVELLTGTAASIKAALTKLGVVPDAWLAKLRNAEKAGKDRSGVQDDINKAGFFKESVLKAHSDRLKLLSTTPEYCSICAVGFAIGNNDVTSYLVGDPHPTVPGTLITESDIIASIWSRIAQCSPLICFNGLHFDLPVLFARSAILQVPSTRRLDLKPWGSDVLDLYYGRFGSAGNSDSKRPGTLKKLAKVYGIEIPAGDVDGSMVYEAMQSAEGRDLVRKYVGSDVEILRALHRRLAGYFWV